MKAPKARRGKPKATPIPAMPMASPAPAKAMPKAKATPQVPVPMPIAPMTTDRGKFGMK